MTKKRQIVNIVNFIRAVEPRRYIDLIGTVEKQIELMDKHKLPGTFLIQYDALIMPEYQELLKKLDPNRYEIGVWHEVVQPLVEDCGYTWTGRYPWDWHCHCGFPVGYTKEQREKLIDRFFEEFKKVFGYYPRSFGSWFFDTHTIRYASEKYGLDALCNCKEQYGTDGYTLWGGYYGQGYYPAKKNVFHPAQTESEQIDAPLFRMLGSDPLYQYDFKIDPACKETQIQHVITLEPSWIWDKPIAYGGACKSWVDWYMKENFNGDCLSFGYAQAGQENSFGWEWMSGGLTYQFGEFARLRGEGKIEVETLGNTGRWFKKTYKTTPASAITAHDAFDDPDKNSVWYCTKNYRVNLYSDHGKLRIRDLHIFDENYMDPFEDRVCEANEATYEALPWIDGTRYTGFNVRAGMYMVKNGVEYTAGEMSFIDLGDGNAKVSYGEVEFTLTESKVIIKAPWDFRMQNRIGKLDDHIPMLCEIEDKKITYAYDGVSYDICLGKGKFADSWNLVSEDGVVEIILK